jgi:hypothetical protein
MPIAITELTYGLAIQQICRLVGHPIPADPAGSTDAAVQQMGAAINFALSELLTMHEWQDLTVKATLPIVSDFAGQTEKGFDLPDDFYRFIDQTQWGSSSMLPAGGPVSNQSWMAYIIQSFSPQMTLFWQMRGDQLWILNPPDVSVNFEYMYLSDAQVIDESDPTLFKNVAATNGDTFKLDSFIIMLLGRARYLEWKGFDASAAVRDFLAMFNSRVGQDGAPILSLNRGTGLRLIDPWGSLPNTGYGS